MEFKYHNRGNQKKRERPIIVWDTETTGLGPKTNRLVEIGMMELKCTSPYKTLFTFSSLIHPPGIEKPRAESRIHGITNLMIQDAPGFGDVWHGIKEFVDHISFGRGRPILVAHNLAFDIRFLKAELARISEELPDWDFACSLRDVANALWPGEKASLEALTRKFDIVNEEAHRALSDVEATSAFLGKVDDHIRSINKEKGKPDVPSGREIRDIIEAAASRRRNYCDPVPGTRLQQTPRESYQMRINGYKPIKIDCSNEQTTVSQSVRNNYRKQNNLIRKKSLALHRKNRKSSNSKKFLANGAERNFSAIEGKLIYMTRTGKVWHNSEFCPTLKPAKVVVMSKKERNEKKALRSCIICRKRALEKAFCVEDDC